MESKSLEDRLDEILREREILLNTKTLLIKENRSIINESRCIRRALRQSLTELELKRLQKNLGN